MYKKKNRFKKLKLKEKRKLQKEEKKKSKTPQNCKSGMQRQRFITTIKNVAEKNKKK